MNYTRTGFNIKYQVAHQELLALLEHVNWGAVFHSMIEFFSLFFFVLCKVLRVGKSWSVNLLLFY